MTYQLYWGDLHSHCSISYGQGTLKQALLRAQQQLDFCSITGHAFWPDMPVDRQRYGEIIDYHKQGFAKLAESWPRLIARQAAASEEGRFVAFPSYEWHSLQYGDYNVYARGPELDLRDANDLPQLRQLAQRSGAILVPHHIGYAAGYRGVDWQHFRDDCSPLVEVFSLHGCSESESAPYAMLHDMGPRDAGSTAEAGWQAGHRFGIIGSTDHHGGFPGSHGDGRVAVFAERLTRQSLWDALLARRVYAVTGDKIDARMMLNGAWIGSTVAAKGKRHLDIQVEGIDALDRVELLKNGFVVGRFFPSIRPLDDGRGRFRLRITWGWGRKDVAVPWHGELQLSDGEILSVDPCFSGQTVVAPQGIAGHDKAADEQDLPHAIVHQSTRSIQWRSVTTGNLSTRHPTTQALSLDLICSLAANVSLDVGGQRFVHPLRQLLRAGRAHYLEGWLSQAIRIGPLTPHADCQLTVAFDDLPQRDVDMYRLRVAQANQQWAWLTPIWVEQM